MSSVSIIPEVLSSIPGYALKFSWNVGSGAGSTQPREDNWVPPCLAMRGNEIRLKKLKLRVRNNDLLTTRAPALPSCSNRFSWHWVF